MKKLLRSVMIACLLFGAYAAAQAQSKTTTIIVVRHAEKEAVNDPAMQADPPLSAAGLARAESLVAALKEFKPTAIYSTNYTRTKSTVTPLAKKLGVDVQVYDARNQPAFADQLKALEGKTIVVAGHSNTVPRLVNLFVGANKYADLEDSVYDQIYVVTITDGVATVEVRKY